jgi:hypothetical protein
MRAACIRTAVNDLPRSASAADVAVPRRVAFFSPSATCYSKEDDLEHWLHRCNGASFSSASVLNFLFLNACADSVPVDTCTELWRPGLTNIPTPASHCRYLPGVKSWIDRQVHWGWMKSVQDRCRTHPSLKNREEEIMNAMQREVSSVTERYQHLETDSRSHTNIQIAAQTLATHKVLLPYVRNENEVMQMLREQNGAKSEEGIRCAVSHGFNCALPYVKWLFQWKFM